MMDAAILRVYEKRFKEPKFRDPAWDTYQAAKMDRALAHFEATDKVRFALRRHVRTCSEHP
jgi:hypothetical protein